MKTNNYNENALDDLMAEISPEDQRKTDRYMMLAAKIEDAMNAKGMRKGDLAEAMGHKSRSIVTKWLSGTHNFTIETLLDLERVLDVELLSLGNAFEKVQSYQKIRILSRLTIAEPEARYVSARNYVVKGATNEPLKTDYCA